MKLLYKLTLLLLLPAAIFANNDKLYTINPVTGAKSSPISILGLHNTGGGDLAFAADGTLFMCTFSGLYRLELNADNKYQSTRISADNLPFNPTSMTFDSNEELWLADNSAIRNIETAIVSIKLSNTNTIILSTDVGALNFKSAVTIHLDTSR